MNEFEDVFSDDFIGFPPPREIDFGIDLEPNTKQNFNSSLHNGSSWTEGVEAAVKRYQW